AENDLTVQCRDLGGVVLLGDAADPRMLRRARIGRATHLFALCGDDGVNAEVAVRAAQLVPSRSGTPLTCVLHIFDAKLCDLLRERELDSDTAGRIRLGFFNTFDLGARVLLEEHPLCLPGDDPATASSRMVIVGVGLLGESLLVNAARQWHAGGALTGTRLQVTLIDQNAREIAAKLAVRYPGLNKLCDIESLEMDVRSATFQQADFLAPHGLTGRPACVFVCMDDDSLTLAAALALAARSHNHNPMIVVRMARNAGLAVLLQDVDSIGGSFRHLRAFGLLDRTCHPDQVLRGTQEILARAIHDAYLRQQLAVGVKLAKHPSMVPWDDLPEHLRESNRRQADDIKAKLKAVHCRTAPMLDWDEPLFVFTPEEMERLGRMEHERWMAEKQQAGRIPGAIQDSKARTHPGMVPYDELPLEEQEKDLGTVRQIPSLLASLGFGVHRLPLLPDMIDRGSTRINRS
ncbi:MAG: RyR domain-containing protein, partial [Verrucomicrobia bacterium]|nr:RyR domain-containing protein [Verrucomicrobiota bacterium]